MTTSSPYGEKETNPALSASEARAGFNDLLNRVRYGHERVTITRQGKPAAAVISMEDLALLERIEDRLWGELALGRLEDERSTGEPRIAWSVLKSELGL